MAPSSIDETAASSPHLARETRRLTLRSRSYGHEIENLRCRGHCNITVIAATLTKARKLAAFSSYRVATLRYYLTLDQDRSHRSRSGTGGGRRPAVRWR